MLGLIESVDQKLDKLLATDFNAGVRHFKELLIATKEQEFLLKEAWRRFGVAIVREEGERKALAYLGLAYCQYRLEEKECALNTLQELTRYNYEDKKERNKKALLMTAAMYPPFATGAIFAGAIGLATMSDTIQKHLDSAGIKDAKDVHTAFLKWMTTVPSEQRVNLLKQQAQEFINEEMR